MNKFPNEVIYIIFNYIEINNLGLICETNKQLYNLGIEYRDGFRQSRNPPVVKPTLLV